MDLTLVEKCWAGAWIARPRAAYRTEVPVHPGLTAKITLVVSDDDTAVAAHSGDVPVLSTPRIVALCEEAAVSALEGQLTGGETSVGMRVQLDHLPPVS